MKNFIKFFLSLAFIIVMMIQCRPDDGPKDLSVNLYVNPVTICYGETLDVGFYAKDYVGNVTVSAPSVPEGLTVAGTFDKSKGEGMISITSSIPADSEINLPLDFSDNASKTTINLVVRTSKQYKGQISMVPNSDAIYPYPSNMPVEISYSISDFDADELNVEFSEGLTGSLDKTNNKIIVLATESLGTEGTVTLKASNKKMEISRTLTLKKAQIALNITTYSAPIEGGQTTVTVKSNVKYHCQITDGEGMLTVTNEGDIYTITVSANTGMDTRRAYVNFIDENEILKETLSVVQTVKTSAETDYQALKEIFDALDGPNWGNVYDEDGRYLYGDDDVLTTWFIKENLDDWIFVGAYGPTDPKNYNRVFRLGFSYAPCRRGVMPDALGRLDMMWAFYMYGSNVTGLPDNLGNLTRMREFVIQNNPLNFRLDTHKGLMDMIHNAPQLNWFSLVKCGLYGSIPEWLGDMMNGKTENNGGIDINLEANYLSGQVPDKVVKVAGWNRVNCIDLDRDGIGEMITDGELALRQQGDHGEYALWVGEKPDNVKFVEDEHGGHWEWIGENPYRDNSRYPKDYNSHDERHGEGFYNDGIHF